MGFRSYSSPYDWSRGAQYQNTARVHAGGMVDRSIGSPADAIQEHGAGPRRRHGRPVDRVSGRPCAAIRAQCARRRSQQRQRLRVPGHRWHPRPARRPARVVPYVPRRGARGHRRRRGADRRIQGSCGPHGVVAACGRGRRGGAARGIVPHLRDRHADRRRPRAQSGRRGRRRFMGAPRWREGRLGQFPMQPHRAPACTKWPTWPTSIHGRTSMA